MFCENKVQYIDYKNISLIRQFTDRFVRIKPKKYTGVCLQHQKMLSRAMKNAREMALVPYTTIGSKYNKELKDIWELI